MNDIKVYVVKFQDRDNYAMKYTDPETGQNVRRSTGTTKRKEADKVAAKWEAERRRADTRSGLECLGKSFANGSSWTARGD